MSKIYLGIAGIVSHDEHTTTEYNKLLKVLGTEGMLMQFERWADTDTIREIIEYAKDNLFENNIKI
jgi:hypothetical protein